MKNKFLFFTGICLMLGIALNLTACGAQEAPELIGSYPSEPNGNQSKSNSPYDAVLVYEAEIDLQVRDVYRSSEKITRLANQYGGYLVDSQTWFLGDEDHARLIVKVPSSNFFPMYKAIKKLGEVEFETYIGEPDYDFSKGIGRGEMSEINIHLMSTPSWYDVKPDKNWWPLITFQNAFDVSKMIIAFIIDVLIWVIVVLGPLALAFLGIKRILQHFHPSKSKDST